MRKFLILIVLAGCLSACASTGFDHTADSQAGSEPFTEVFVTEQTNQSGFDNNVIKELPKNTESLTEIVVSDMGHNGYVFVSEDIYLIYEDNRYYYLSAEGESIGAVQYDLAYPFQEGLACVQQDGKYGFINSEGETVIPFLYDKANPFSEGLAYFELADRYGFIDPSGNEVFYPDCDSVSSFREGAAYISVNGKYGYINNQGEIMIELIYDDVTSFENGLAKVRIGSKIGVIDRSGDEIIPIIYDNIEIEEGFFIVELNNAKGCFYENGAEILAVEYDYVFSVGQQYIQFGRDNEWGIADCLGILLAPEYDMISIAADQNIAIIRQHDKEGIISLSGEILLAPQYDTICFGSASDIASVFLNDRYGLISLSDYTEITPLIYDAIYTISNNRAEYWKDGKAGVLNERGIEIVSSVYDNINITKNNIMILKKDGKSYFADFNGELIDPLSFDSIEPSGNVFIVGRGSRYGMFDQNGKQILPFDYEQFTMYQITGLDYMIPNCYIGIKHKDGRDIRTIIKTGEYVYSDLTEITGKNDITPRIKTFHDLILTLTKDVNDSSYNISEMYSTRKRLLAINDSEDPVLFVYSQPDWGIGDSFSDLYMIKGETVQSALNAYMSGGRMGGNHVCLYGSAETSDIHIGTVGNHGGFGGTASSRNIYNYENGIVKLNTSFNHVTQSINNYEESLLIEKAGYFYDKEGNPYTKDTIMLALRVTEYLINNENVTPDEYNKWLKKYHYIELFK